MLSALRSPTAGLAGGYAKNGGRAVDELFAHSFECSAPGDTRCSATKTFVAMGDREPFAEARKLVQGMEKSQCLKPFACR